MKPGIYRLTCDVTNPHPDRRSKRDWRKLPVWKAGTIFYVKIDREYGFPVMHSGRWHHQDLRGHRQSPDSEWTALVPHLEPVEIDSVDRLLRADYHVGRGLGEHVLPEAVQLLIDQGKITLADLSAAMTEATERLNSD